MNPINKKNETTYERKILADICVCCGEPVSEGKMICWKCEHQFDDNNSSYHQRNVVPVNVGSTGIDHKKIRLFRSRGNSDA